MKSSLSSFINARKSFEKILEHFWKETSLKLNRSDKYNCSNLIKIKEEPIDANLSTTTAQSNDSEVSNKLKLKCSRCLNDKFYQLKSRVFKSQLSLRAHLIKHKYEKIETEVQEKQRLKSKRTKVNSSSTNRRLSSQSLISKTKVRQKVTVEIFTREKSHSFEQIQKNISSLNRFEIRNTIKKEIRNKFENKKKYQQSSQKRILKREKNFECDQCEKKFTQSGNLTKHKRIHIGERPFKCDQCKYKCTRSDALTVHKRIHTGEKPYECGICEFKCSTSTNLTVHKRVHIVFECDECKKIFGQSHHLTRHKKIHSKEKTFKCN